MKQKPEINKILLAITLFSYFFIILPNGKMNLFMFQVLLLSIFGIYDIWTFLYFLAGYSGGGVFLYLLIADKKIRYSQVRLVLVGLVLFYVPLLLYHFWFPFSFKDYDYPVYIVPEIIFIALSVFIFWRILVIETKSKLQRNINEKR